MKTTTEAGNKTFKVHLDGYNLIPYFKGEEKESPRRDFLYWSDDGDYSLCGSPSGNLF
jgi:hypothetical protein